MFIINRAILLIISGLSLFFMTGCSEYFSHFTRKDTKAVYREQTSVFDVDLQKSTLEEEIPGKQFEYSRSERYLVDINDMLNIVVFEEPDLSMIKKVSDEGILSFPLIGDIEVKGLTTQEVERVLEDRLEDGFIRHPKVTVTLDIALMGQYQENEIFVLGGVKNPGVFSMPGEYMTVLEAVTKAGGFTDIAVPKMTMVIRLENDIERTIKVNLNKVKKGDRSLDIILKPGDTIVVPDKYF